jgi:hypothetical protein
MGSGGSTQALDTISVCRVADRVSEANELVTRTIEDVASPISFAGGYIRVMSGQQVAQGFDICHEYHGADCKGRAESSMRW